MNRYSCGKKTFFFTILFCVAAAMIPTDRGGTVRAEGESSELPDSILDKTLVVWASPADLPQRGGSALTIDMASPDAFDGIVFGELTPGTWMPGSTTHLRTQEDQTGWPRETPGESGDYVMIAVVYHGKNVAMYRNGQRIAEYEMKGNPQPFTRDATILFGPRHVQSPRDVFAGRIRDARIYDGALSPEQLAAMKPGEPLEGRSPWAWWDFAATGPYERTGHWNQIRLTGDAAIRDGALVLGKGDGTTTAGAGAGAMMATRSDQPASRRVAVPKEWSKETAVPAAATLSARVLREKFLDDPYRPGWHFAIPEGMGMPGDPNGCFYADGRYHLMYLYNREGSGFCWGHLSSADLVHWRNHPDSIGPGDGDEGCFSGGGFVDDDGTAYLSYWMLWGARGIGLAKSDRAHYDRWEKLPANPVIPSTEWGITETQDADGRPLVYGSADPSNIWKKDGKYYMCCGNLLVLDKYGRGENAPEEMRGDRLWLFESDDLRTWNYRGVFYDRNPEWTHPSEDNMCPSFLPLPASPDGGPESGRHLLLFISHNMGCQYYVGTYDAANGRFVPENHGRMTWVDNTYFAPEALVDEKGRQIMWAWLTDNPDREGERGWSGVYGLPRTLWLGDDGTLRMKPVDELAMLRQNPIEWKDLRVSDASPVRLENVPGDSCELEIRFGATTASKYGVRVRMSPDGEEQTLLYYDRAAGRLCMDSTRSGVMGRRTLEQAPLTLTENEPLTLRVFVDRSVIEVYANDRQAICRRVYPGRDDSLGLELFAEQGDARVTELTAWEMMPSNPD